MTRAGGLAVLALVALTGLGCDGEAASETRDFAAFQEIETEGDFDLDVTIGATQSVVLEGDARDLESLETRVVRGRLKLEADRNVAGDNPVWRHNENSTRLVESSCCVEASLSKTAFCKSRSTFSGLCAGMSLPYLWFRGLILRNSSLVNFCSANQYILRL